MAAAALFAPVAKHRVNNDNPVKDIDELDVDRCAALHNTLTLYGWICSGKPLAALQKKSWWSRYGNTSLQKLLRPSVVRYLSKIFDVPSHNFFYHVSGLARPAEMLQLGDLLADEDHDDDKTEKYRFIVIYNTSRYHVTNRAGIVYDQQTHMALLMPTYNHIFDLKDKSLPWQKLETILSAYFDMIEGEKVMVIPDSVDDDVDEETSASNRRMSNTMQLQMKTRPWAVQPYTKGDLETCLDVWKRLVQTIEKKAGLQQGDDASTETLCSRTALNVAQVPRGFAYDILSHAKYTSVWFVAPGIRLPKVEEFLHQPFKDVAKKFPKETLDVKMPFLFLRCPGEVSAKEAKFRYPFSTVESVPCGLYLDAFPNAMNPFEDACRLVLPIRLGANRYARMSDMRPIRKTFSDLYQSEINPFVPRHGPKLVAILENWLENIERGHWTVNEKGVEGGVGTWRQADTRENWWRYQSKHLSI